MIIIIAVVACLFFAALVAKVAYARSQRATDSKKPLIAPEHRVSDRAAADGVAHTSSISMGEGLGEPVRADSENTTKTTTGLRHMDVRAETGAIFTPVTRIMDSADLTIAEAALHTGVRDMDSFGYMAQANGRELAASDPYNLTADEAGFWNLYSANSSFYEVLNQKLRSKDRKALEQFLPVLKLMKTGSEKLPKCSGSLLRGVAGQDLSAQYPRGAEVWWWAISSCSPELETMQRGDFLGSEEGVRTLFMIQAQNAIDITRYSAFPDEAEMILLPGTKLYVKSSMAMAGGLHIVQLEEMSVPVAMLK